ncbi:MAG: aspartate aminotransferase family protein, partial [Thermoprotei archaeon]
MSEDLDKEIESLSYPEAPKIVTSEVPGPKSKEYLARVYEKETVTLLAPYVIPFVWEEAKGATIKDPDGNTFIDMPAGV